MGKSVLTIETPESCYKCPIGQNTSNAMEDSIHCPIINKTAIGKEIEKRHEDCPLVELSEKLEEQGLILRFPCKVGDTVWFVGQTFVNDYEVRRFIIDETGIDCIQMAKEIDGRDYWNSCCCEDFGKTVFLSEFEAQEALERMVQNG